MENLLSPTRICILTKMYAWFIFFKYTRWCVSKHKVAGSGCEFVVHICGETSLEETLVFYSDNGDIITQIFFKFIK